MNFYGQTVCAFHHIQELLLVLLQLVGLAIEVFDDLGRTLDRRQSGDVVQRRVAGEEGGIWGCEELLVGGLKRHGFDASLRCAVDVRAQMADAGGYGIWN